MLQNNQKVFFLDASWCSKRWRVCDRNEWPLDSMCLQCDVTKKHREDFSTAPREGAYVHGLFMEGARWDTQVRL